MLAETLSCLVLLDAIDAVDALLCAFRNNPGTSCGAWYLKHVTVPGAWSPEGWYFCVRTKDMRSLSQSEDFHLWAHMQKDEDIYCRAVGSRHR